jgi:integrase/recombinase XerD
MYLVKYSKSPYFQIVYFVNGKRTKKSTKKTTKAEGLKVLREFKESFHIESQEQSIRLSKFQEEYVSYSKRSKSNSYVKSINLSFSQLKSFTGDISLHYLTTRILDQFISTAYARSKGAAGLYYRTLKAAFSKAIVWEYITENPLKRIKEPKQVKSFPIFICKEELEKIVDKAKHQLLKDIIITAFFTGMRLGELLSLNWSWIDLNNNLIIIKNSNCFITKSKKERIIPIHQKVKEILIHRSSIDGKSDFVFYRYDGVKLNEDFISKQFKKAVRAAKLNDDIHFHSLRHSFASNLVQRGVNLYVIKELLGHEDIKTTQVYSHLTQSSLSNAVGLL